MNLEKNPNPTILVQRSQEAEPQSTLLATSSLIVEDREHLQNKLQKHGFSTLEEP